jgi:hypothetical protein
VNSSDACRSGVRADRGRAFIFWITFMLVCLIKREEGKIMKAKIGYILMFILIVLSGCEYINDTIAEGVVFFICFPGIIVGIIGAIVCALRKK